MNPFHRPAGEDRKMFFLNEFSPFANSLTPNRTENSACRPRALPDDENAELVRIVLNEIGYSQLR
jgi:hypothetical protein